MPLAIPTIHMNGTSRNDLLDQHAEAVTAIMDAITKLRAATPNGRDYYPQGSEAITQARREHDARIRRLTEVQNEIEEIAEAIASK